MTKLSKEKILMAKSLKEVDGPWEAIAFIFTWRQKEAWRIVALVSIAGNIAMLGLYTKFFQTIFLKILSFF